MFGAAPPAPSPAERAAARLQVRQTFRGLGFYIASLWTPLVLYYVNQALGRHIA
ncbi:uncharacterized protein PSFLO_07001 [Pseudozyma flocculosa]|uniref:MFS transporter n=1 Tax=Pseudozyma flocculosa TaxID=84751 RepID=A0A5C3FDT3_9BASI|nr:uncharacterized protein PSFLO_07001 [Pseudozyma flocculosa]